MFPITCNKSLFGDIDTPCCGACCMSCDLHRVFICDIYAVVLLVARRQAKREGTMFRVLVVCYVIGFVSCQMWLNSTKSDAEINGTIVNVSELVTKSDTTVSEVELATASTHSVRLNPLLTEDFMLNDRKCPNGSSKPCVVKCCPLGESITMGKACEPSTLKFQVIFFGESGESNATAAAVGDYDYIFGDPCLYNK